MSDGGIPCENSNRRESHFLADSALQLQGELKSYLAISDQPIAPNTEEWQIHNSVKISKLASMFMAQSSSIRYCFLWVWAQWICKCEEAPQEG